MPAPADPNPASTSPPVPRRGWPLIRPTLVRATSRRRGNRPARPGVEGLEGRLVLAGAPLDLTFGQAGVVLGRVLTATTSSLRSPAPAAIATTADGKIVTAGPDQTANTAAARLFVRRYLADGTADPSSGAGGVVAVALAATAAGTGLSGHGLAIAADGSVLFDVVHSTTPAATGGTLAPARDSTEVGRPTPGGRLDAPLGVGGLVVGPFGGGPTPAIAVQADGKVILAGTTSATDDAVPDQIDV